MKMAANAAELEGLQAGQQVIVQPDDRIRDGTRIKALAAR